MDTRYRNGALLVSGLLLAVWLAPIGRAQDINPSVRLDGAPLRTDAPAILDKSAGRTLVPARSLAEAMGYLVTWDKATQAVTATQDGHVIAFRIGETEATVDGQPVTMGIAPRMVKGRALVPLRFFAEASGARVEWDEQTKSVDILSPTSLAGDPASTLRMADNGIQDARFTSKALPFWNSQAMTGTDRGLGNPAVTGDGLIYATTDEGKLYAINRESGDTAWSADIDGGYPSRPLYDAARSRVYLTNGNGQLLAFDAETGKRVWFASIRETQQGRSQPVMAGDLIVVNAGDDKGSTLAAFNPETGSKTWQAAGPGAGPVAAFGARIFVQDQFGGIHAYRKASGATIWQHEADQDKPLEGGSLLVAAGRVYAAGANQVIALDEATGKQVWVRKDVNMAKYGGMTTDQNELWVVVADGVMVLDAQTGATLQYPAICKSGQSTPVMTKGNAYLACDSQIFAINRSTFAATPLAAGQGALALDGDRMYYTSLDDFRLSALMALPER